MSTTMTFPHPRRLKSKFRRRSTQLRPPPRVGKTPTPKPIASTILAKPTANDDLQVFGCIDKMGCRRVEVVQHGVSALVRLEDVTTQPKVALGQLADAGIAFLDTASIKHFKQKVEAISDWRPIDVAVERGPHNGNCFVFSDSFVALKPGAKAPEVLVRDSAKWQAQGTVEQWGDAAKLVAGQQLPIFVASLSFVPALAAVLPGFERMIVEVVGEDVDAIRGFLGWSCSPWGGIADRSCGFIESWPASLNDLEASMRDHAGCLLPYELTTVGAGRAGQRLLAEKVIRLSHGLGQNGQRLPTTPAVCLIGSNKSLLARLSGSSQPDVLVDLSSRIVTVPARISPELGVFDKLPKGLTHSEQALEQLEVASAKFFGTPIHEFLQILLREWSNPVPWVRAVINICIQDVIERTNVDLKNPRALRVARFFGVVYAAGYLARKWGLLPKAWKIGWAVMRCYRKHLFFVGAMPQEKPAFEIIRDYARTHWHQLDDLRSGKKIISDATFQASWGFLQVGQNKELELCIPPQRMHREFSCYMSMMQKLRHQGRARVEGGEQPKLTTKVDIRGNGKLDRVYCILLGPATTFATPSGTVARPTGLDEWEMPPP